MAAEPKTSSIQGVGNLIYSVQLRDLFAMQIANTLVFVNPEPEIEGYTHSSMHTDWVAQRSYQYADALLKAREACSE